MGNQPNDNPDTTVAVDAGSVEEAEKTTRRPTADTKAEEGGANSSNGAMQQPQDLQMLARVKLIKIMLRRGSWDTAIATAQLALSDTKGLILSWDMRCDVAILKCMQLAAYGAAGMHDE